jgi:hypothetical protein
MKRDWNITDGTAQDDRFPLPLDDRSSRFFHVDERTFEDMVSRTADFAKVIRFYNLRDQIDGTWINLFYADEAVVMAEIIATDYALMEAEFIGHGSNALLEAAGYVVRFAERFDSWYRRLSHSEDELSQVLRRAITDRKLRAAIGDVRRILTHLEGENPATSREGLRRLATFHEHWGGRNFEITITETSAEPENRDTGDQVKSKLYSAFYTFVHSVDSLKPIARRSLARSLENGKHDPSMALFMAFGKLFDKARDRLNLFTARHRDFYYRNVLGMTPKPETPDSTCLVFQLEAGTTSLTIQKGTEFTAGKAGGEVELIYKSDAELNVTDARVLDLRTLNCSRDPLVSPAYQLQYVNAAWALRIGNAAADAPPPASEAISWPLFGAEKPGANVSPGEEATIGFAIASSALLLREGNRTITLSVAFRVPGKQDLTWDKVDPLSLTVDRVLQCADLNAKEAAAWILEQMKSQLESNPEASPDISECLNLVGDGRVLIQNPDTSPRALVPGKSPSAPSAVSPDEESRVDLGRQFRYVILNHNALPADTLAAFRKRVALTFSDENSNDLLVQDPLFMFHRVFGTAFRIDITTAAGWYTAQTYSVSMQSPPTGASDQSFELDFTLELDTGAPALAGCDPKIHGQGYRTSLPVLRFCLNPGAIVYPYSILQDLAVQRIAVRSDVSDATRIVAWNQQGQLDPSKPFNPFGPLPTTNSYLVLGNFDSAKMNLTSLRLRLEWGELPDVDFADYYAGYDGAYANDKFVVTQSALRDGRWVPARPEGTPSSLFRTDSTKAASENVIEINIVRYLKPVDPELGEEQFQYGRDARDGFFRLSLAGPEGAFGHAEYPGLLSGVLSENARASTWRRRDPEKLPNPPYTPIINRMSLAYTAESAIGGAARAANSPDAFSERVYSIHPFGMKNIDTNKEWPLLPEIEFDGSLFIGFDATEAGGGLTLLFHLCEASATSIAPQPEPVFWHYLASDQWRPLGESQVLSDTTEGFLSSGIVTLDLPDDITTGNSVMPGDLYWLRVSAQRNLRSFCRIYGVWTQAVKVTRCLAEKAPVSAQPLPAATIRGPVKSIPGLRSVSQPIPSTEGQAAETEQQMIERTSERLRHKYRASTPWDYERIILAQFPDVFKVKCFPALSSSVGDRVRPVPGSVLIVVMPRPDEYNIFAPMMDAVRLMRIQDFLRDKISPFAQVEVRNPAYERVQVVCRVRLTDAARGQRGRYLSLLNQDIVAWFSPWKNSFGWSFSENQVKAHIRDLPYVDDVTTFSMLHITQNEQDETYRLSDTARAPFTDKIAPRYPWSLAIASPVHDIQLADKPAGDGPSATGIGQMRIGNTFITVK